MARLAWYGVQPTEARRLSPRVIRELLRRLDGYASTEAEQRAELAGMIVKTIIQHGNATVKQTAALGKVLGGRVFA